MTEIEMQKSINSKLTQLFTKSQIFNEYPLIPGTNDILMIKNQLWYQIEIKIHFSSHLIKQINKHRATANYLLAISMKPKNIATQEKWIYIANKKNINIIWYEDIFQKKLKRRFRKLIQNNNLNQVMRNAIYYGY